MIRHTIAVAILALGVASCSDKPTPTAPSTENTIKFTATLSAASEVPPVSNAEAGAGGSVNITFNLTRDASGNITAATADFSTTLNGFPAGTGLTAAHIHPGFSGLTGGVAVNTGLASGEVTLGNGSGSFTKNGATVTLDQAAGVIANPAGFYFNVHTALNPGGAVRGQLSRVP